MLFDQDNLPVLAVDCRLEGGTDGIGFIQVDSAQAALMALRGNCFELLLTSGYVAGEAVWPLVDKIRRVRPKLRWWLIARGLTCDEEVLARTLGVTRILYAAPTAQQVRSAFRPSCVPAAESLSPPPAYAVGPTP